MPNPELSSFILSLIQAFLKTGYYTPSHPEAQRARFGLYENLKSVLGDKGEISFISVTERDKQEIYIAGIFDEPTPLKSFMIKSMAEMFTPKFLDYFEKKNLSSFSMKAAISKDEFAKFLDIMTESPLYEDKEIDVRDKLVMELLRSDVFMVSTVFNVDLVGKGRKLPWRIEVSLSRLKKDLNMIPLYKNVSEERLKEIRRMVFEDILRPLKEPSLIKEMLLNLDLISADLVGFKPGEFERMIVEHLDKKNLRVISQDLVRNIFDVRKAFEKVQDVEMLVRLEYLRGMTRKVIQKLIEGNMYDEDIFLNLVRNRVFNLDELPNDIRQKIAVFLSLDRFMESSEQFFKEINEIHDDSEREKRITVLFEFLPTLFSAGRYKDILQIFIVAKKEGIDSELKEHVGLVEKVCDAVFRKAAEGSKEDQLELLNVLSSLDVQGTYMLINLLDNESRFVRRLALEMLSKKGTEIKPYVMEMLNKKQGWFYTRNALQLLSMIGASGPDVDSVFAFGLKHEEPNVRKEAVQGLPAVLGKKGEPLLIPLLNDKDPDVKKKAISSLGVIGSTNNELLKFFEDVLKGETTEDETVKKEVIRYLTNVPIPVSATPELEKALITILKESVLLRIVKKESEQGLHLKADALTALGTIGTPKSLKLLGKYSSHKNQVLSRAAAGSIARIKARFEKSG